MNDFRGNIDHWIRQSEPDYYLFFLKAWIPFNAWYVAELPHLNKSDRKIIKELQDNTNSKPRKTIESYLTNRDSTDSKKFRIHLAELHRNLESKRFIHNGSLLSFTSLQLTQNPKKFAKDIDSNGNIFKAESKSSYFQALIVDKSGKTTLDFKIPHFNIEELRKDTDFIKLDDRKIQSKILKCYEEINPEKPTNLVSLSKEKDEFISLASKNQINFINDPTTIAKGCIKILYSLRCMLFHGEVEPTNSNKPVYEHAYNLLRFLIKELH